VAHCDLTEEQIIENINIAVTGLIEKIPRKWKNIQSVHLKTSESIALPLYNSLPEETVSIGVNKKPKVPANSEPESDESEE
jgi:ribosome biogenesis protein UTP30